MYTAAQQRCLLLTPSHHLSCYDSRLDLSILAFSAVKLLCNSLTFHTVVSTPPPMSVIPKNCIRNPWNPLWGSMCTMVGQKHFLLVYLTIPVLPFHESQLSHFWQTKKCCPSNIIMPVNVTWSLSSVFSDSSSALSPCSRPYISKVNQMSTWTFLTLLGCYYLLPTL